MSLINESHDSLPYIDPPLAPNALSNATSLIESELASTTDTNSTHPHLPHGFTPRWPELLTQEHTRLASGTPKETGIELSRFELPDLPASGSGPSEHKEVTKLSSGNNTFLTHGGHNLSLLERYGKNIWLISNSQLTDVLSQLEKDLASLKREVEMEEGGRMMQQQSVQGEMKGLEQDWSFGVGKMVETELAVEGLRREVLERKRSGAMG